MEEQSRRDVETRPTTEVELHLLIGDLKDEVTRYRRREAAWISLAVHGAFVIALIFMPKWLPRSMVIVPVQDNNKDAIFLEERKSPIVKPLKTDIISDQDRRAQTPVPDKETLRKLLDATRPGPRQPAPQPQQPPQAAQAQPQPASQLPPQPQTTETAKLEAPQPKQNPFTVKSPSASINQAIQSAANSHTTAAVPFGGGDRGSGIHPRVDARGGMEILSDTLGVDFGPYLKRLKVTVEDHWFPLIPEDALPPMMKKGRVIIEFAIMKDGSIQGLTVVSSSGDTALDRAAYGALQNAVPLPRLPADFTGPFLRIRAAFYYNPDKNDFE
jgi:TonB family protein